MVQYDWPVVIDGGGRPHVTELLRSALQRLQRQAGRAAPAGGVMPAWALEVRPGAPAELQRPWPAPSHIGPWSTRAADALGVPVATWPMLGGHPLTLVLNWPTDDVDVARVQKLAEVMVWGTQQDRAAHAPPPGAAVPTARPEAAVHVGTAVPRPPSYAAPTATAAYSHVAVANPLRASRGAVAPPPVSSGNRVGFG